MNQKRAHERLHALWTASKGPEYDKKTWRDLQVAIAGDPPDVSAAAVLFARLREVAVRNASYERSEWDAFEEALLGSTYPKRSRGVEQAH
jgi:hypothetical protein